MTDRFVAKFYELGKAIHSLNGHWSDVHDKVTDFSVLENLCYSGHYNDNLIVLTT